MDFAVQSILIDNDSLIENKGKDNYKVNKLSQEVLNVPER